MSKNPVPHSPGFLATFSTVRMDHATGCVRLYGEGVHALSLQTLEFTRSPYHVCKSIFMLTPPQATYLHAQGLHSLIRAAVIHNVKIGDYRMIVASDIVLSGCADDKKKKGPRLVPKRAFVLLEGVLCSSVSIRDHRNCEFIHGDQGRELVGDCLYELCPGGLIQFRMDNAKSVSSVEFINGKPRFTANCEAFE